MFSPEALSELCAHMEWADAEVWSVALSTDGASGDVSLRDKLFHVHQTQRAYLNMWTDRPQEIAVSKAVDSLVTLCQWARPYYAEAQRFLHGADSSTLEAPVPELFRRRMEQHLGRGRFSVTLGETVFDVVSHTAHHRGQINMRLRELNGEPPLVDYVAWVWRGRPAAEWDRPAAGG